MMEMVSSNVQLHNKIGDATIRRNEGVRCSKRVLDGMCMQMATTSASTNNNNSRKSCSYENENDRDYCQEPCSSNGFGKGDESRLRYSHSDGDEESNPWPSSSAKEMGPLYNPDDFEVLELLGQGFFSKVFKVRHRTSGEVLVLKESKLTETCRRQTHANTARESKIMKRLEHENVLKLKGICVSVEASGKWDTNLLISYCEGGSLAAMILDKQTHFTWLRRFVAIRITTVAPKVQYAIDIASAMEYIHGKGYIHRDLTSSNVLIQMANSGRDNGWGKAVVADFGLSCKIPNRGEKLAQVGTTYFMSPECLKEEYYDEKSDVFSFGVILCQMIARIDADPEGGLPRTSKFGFDYVLFTPLCPTDTPIELLKLAFNSCVMDPTARPSFEEAKKKLEEISKNLEAMMGPGHKAAELSKETRLGRSRSDAALKRPKALAATARKLSTNFNSPKERTVFEGEVVDDTKLRKIEALARDAAKEEPDFRHMNPFVGHARFRNERKIIPKTTASTPRRRSETKQDRVLQKVSPSVVMSTPRRRCLSMPCCINDPENNEHYTSFSYDGTFAGDEGVDALEYVDGTASPASGIPMAYRDFDRKFLKQMIRFPSRRHTMHDSVGKTSASNYDVSKVGLATSTNSSEEKRRFGGGKEAKSRNGSQTSSEGDRGDKEEKCQSIVVYEEKPLKLKRRIGQICSSAHQNADCCIL